jgi:mannose-6-phosphate isomerase-like protein (cupin superfamily)
MVKDKFYSYFSKFFLSSFDRFLNFSLKFKLMKIRKINIGDKFDLFKDYWSPKIIAELNGQDIKLAKVKGEFVWHNHKNEDELFFIVKGTLKIKFSNKIIELNEGEMLIVPKGIEHKPIAEEEVWLLLFEPSNTKHTGEVKSDLTIGNYERI